MSDIFWMHPPGRNTIKIVVKADQFQVVCISCDILVRVIKIHIVFCAHGGNLLQFIRGKGEDSDIPLFKILKKRVYCSDCFL